MTGNEVEQKLRSICPDLLNFNTIAVLDVNVSDYIKPIVKENYTLVRIADKQDVFKEITQFMLSSTEGYSERYQRSKFLFAFRRKETNMSFDRFAVYLHNKFSQSLMTKFSRIILALFDCQYMDWKRQWPITNNNLEITKEVFEDFFKISSQNPSLMDFDVQLILDAIQESHKDFLFRGIPNTYKENDDIASSNYRRHKDFALSGMLQQHEKEIVNRLISNGKAYGSTDPICALTDLRHRGADTNILDWSENYKASLYFACEKGDIAEFLKLPKNQLQEMKKMDYITDKNVNKDYILKPNYGSENNKRVEAQSSIFVYCHQGFLPRDEYDGIIKNILIPNEVKNLLLNYSGFGEFDIYPDFDHFMETLKDYKTIVMKKHEPVDSANYINVLSSIYPNLENFQIHYFLDIEIANFPETNQVHGDGYVIHKVDKNNIVVRNLKGVFGPEFTGDEIMSLEYILGTNDTNILEKFNQFLRVNYSDNFNDFKPVFFGYQHVYGDWVTSTPPKNKKLKISMEEVEKIIFAQPNNEVYLF